MNTFIRDLGAQDYPEFFAYLNTQLLDNGKNGFPLFQPVSREEERFPQDKEASFVAGLSKTIGQPGWRRAWVICNADGKIMGHVDLRGPTETGISHRALLGMGVGGDYRRQGLARQLLEFASQWVHEQESLDWIDIEVLAVNTPAVALYRSASFDELCEVPDMYRIDGNPETVIRMCKKII